MLNKQPITVQFEQPKAELLEKAKYNVVNVMKTMATEFLRLDREHFFVDVKGKEKCFHFKAKKEKNIVYVELVDVVTDVKVLKSKYPIGSYGEYENTGILTKEKID